MKKIFLLSILIITEGILQAQSYKKNESENNCIKDYQFFKGDTLAGFNLQAAVNEAQHLLHLYPEQRAYIFKKEVKFVKAKYKIDKLSFENISENKKVKLNSVLTSACNNLDFENGDFTGWTGGIGYNPNTNAELPITSNTITTLGINSAETSCSFHTLVSTGTDPYGNFPMVPPNTGTYTCRLGGELLNLECDYYNAASPYYMSPSPSITTCNSNDPGVGVSSSFSNGETIQQTFSVTTANSVFTYKYAIVMANAPHFANEQPYFKVEVLDSSGIVIPCLTNLVRGDTTGSGTVPPGFSISFLNDKLGNQVLYLPWSQRTLNLQPYVGTNVTVRFTVAGCSLGGHFCYAYIDASCSSPQFITSASAICSGSPITITAPSIAGGSTYSWSGPGIIGANNTQTIHVNAAGTYTVIMNGISCTNTISLTATVTSSTATPLVININATNPLCEASHDTLVASGATSYTWSANAGSVITNTVNIYPSISTVYSVTGTDGTCTGVDSIKIIVNPELTISVNPVSDTICLGGSAILTASGALNYTWTSTGATVPTITVSPSVNATYFLTGVDNNGCTGYLSKMVYVENCTTGINQLPVNNQLSIYPNPAGNNITIQSSTELSTIVIYNSLGEKVKEVRSKIQETKAEIDISNLPAGVYTINVQGKYTKIVKE